MSRKLLVIAIGVVLLPLTALGQYVTGNQFVFAKVDNGYITWYAGSVNTVNTGKQLSFRSKSFLSLHINGLYYTNNLYATLPAAPNVILLNGNSLKHSDTIKTTWPQATFDIVQDVYPVAFTTSGQIVVRIKIINHSKTAILSAQCEYLLDIEPGTSDNAELLTPYSLSSNWQQFPSAQHPVPPFFLAFQFSPGASGFPGIIGTSYLSDSMAPSALGLHPPSTLVVGDWARLTDYTWSYPNQYMGTPYSDNAVLYEWPATSVPANSGSDSVWEIGRLSYGTGELCQNTGQLYAMMLRPGQLAYDATTKTYSPNPFTIEALLFNMSSTSSLTDVKATLSVNDSLHLLTTATQTLSPSSIAPLDAASVAWTVQAAPNVSAATLFAQVSLDVTATGLSQPAFLNSWDCATAIPTTTEISGIYPHDTILSRVGSFDGSLCNTRCSQAWAYDPRKCKTCGVSGVHTDTVMNMSVTVQDSFAHFTACVVDSMKDGFANVVVSDLAGVPDTVHFTYCTIGDTLRPSMTQGNCKQGLCYIFGENRPWDRGIDTITTSNNSNLNITFTPAAGSWHGATSVAFTATAIDPTKSSSVCLDIKDLAGNHRDTCFIVLATAGVSLSEQSPISLRVVPNPSYGISTISLGDGRTTTIEVVDLLGRIVDRFTMTGSREWDMSKLADGAYILRATCGDVRTSTRIAKQ